MLLGYLEFVLLLFFPGLATLLAFNQVKGSNLVTVLARSYGISLALNALSMFVAMTWKNTSFAAAFGESTGIHAPSLPFVMVGGYLLILVVLGPLRLRSRITLSQVRSISKEQIASLLLGVIFSSLLLSQFIKYPIFPKTYSADFVQHYEIMHNVIPLHYGGLDALLYYGVHYNLALGFSLVGGDTFIQIQYLMAILAAPSSLLFFEVARQIYNRASFALLCQALFIGTGFLWYIPLYDTGLYPNLFSIILSLAFILELRQVLNVGSILTFPSLIVVGAGLYLSHYFAPVFILAVAVSLIFASALRLVGWKRTLPPILIILAPAGLLLFFPQVTNLVFLTLSQTRTQGTFGISTSLADSFAFSPFIKSSIAEIYNYGSIVLIFGLPLSLYYLWKHRQDSWLLFAFPIWFILLWVTAPNGELSWRFALVGMVPLLILSAGTFSEAPGFIRWVAGRREVVRKQARKGRNKGRTSTGQVLLYTILLLLILGGSWTNVMLSDLALNASSFSQSQTNLYNTMNWFAQNTPPESKLLSATDWRIIFLKSITGRLGDIILLAPAPDAISYAKSHGFDYILVTYFIPGTVPVGFDLNSFYGSFSSNQNLTMVYQSGFDVIYQLK